MISVILVIHLLLALAIIGLIMLQRSEGGGLLGSGGGGLGSFASAQTTASVLNRVTWFCAAAFFATSLLLGILYNNAASKRSILDQLDPVTITRANEADAKVQDTLPPAVPKTDKSKPAAKAKPESKKSEPTVPVTP
jgi:preprotein translocase subunit SecG